MSSTTKATKFGNNGLSDEQIVSDKILNGLTLLGSVAIDTVLKSRRNSWKDDTDNELGIILGLKDSADRLNEWIPYFRNASVELKFDGKGSPNDMLRIIGASLIFLAEQLRILAESASGALNPKGISWFTYPILL